MTNDEDIFAQVLGNTLTIICPSCLKEAKFSIPKTDGAWEFACPHCGQKLNRESYDNAAKNYVEVVAELTRSITNLIQRLKRIKRVTYTIQGFGNMPLSSVRGRQRKIFHEKTNPINQRIEEQKAILAMLAQSRYYVSEWYAETRIPLESKIASKDYRKNISLNPTYNDKAEFHIRAKHKEETKCSITDSIGVIGEYYAFESTLQATLEQNSPLANAQIISRAFLPLQKLSKAKRKIIVETDMIILSEQFAVMCEVKYWSRACVQAMPHLGDIFIKRTDEESTSPDGYVPDGSLLRQVENEKLAFIQLEHYPEDRIFKAVIFVNPISLEAKDVFVGDLLVAECGKNDTFKNAIIARAAELDGILSAEEVSDVAADIRENFKSYSKTKQYIEQQTAQTQITAKKSIKSGDAIHKKIEATRRRFEEQHYPNSHKDRREMRIAHRNKLNEMRHDLDE